MGSVGGEMRLGNTQWTAWRVEGGELPGVAKVLQSHLFYAQQKSMAFGLAYNYYFHKRN